MMKMKMMMLQDGWVSVSGSVSGFYDHSGLFISLLLPITLMSFILLDDLFNVHSTER